MASVEVMAACENVCRDFGWLFEWLRELASNPIWALFIGGLISLMIWRAQTKLSFELALKSEKRELYRAFLSQVERCTLIKQKAGVQDWHLEPDIRKLWALQSEISLIGSVVADEASASVVCAMNDFFMRGEERIISKDGIERSLWDNLSFVASEATSALKKDLDERSKP
ncbi:hypothetical protein ACUXV3_10835 [Roseobacteraceae bacterium NS-SX3]